MGVAWCTTKALTMQTMTFRKVHLLKGLQMNTLSATLTNGQFNVVYNIL
ncbi:MAG: hypothetical protein RL085_208, partial [Actinomycetota bacterium]